MSATGTPAALRLCIPVSRTVTVTLTVAGGPLTAAHVALLQRYVALMERAYTAEAPEGER